MDYLNLIKEILTSSKWVEAGAWLIGFLIIAKIITFLSERVFKRWAKNTKTELDDLIIAKIKPPFSYIIILVGLKFALKPLGFVENGLTHILNSIVIIAITYIAFSTIDILVTIWGKEFTNKTKSKLDDSLLPIAQRIIKALFVIIGGIWILKEWNFDVGPFLASLGIAGFVVGFAMQDTLKNIFGGITLILDRTFQVGDKVEVDGTLGVVNDISIRSTKIKTYSNEIVTIPNGKMADAKIKNYVQPNHQARVSVNFGVAYGTEVEKVRELILKTVLKIENCLTDPKPQVLFIKMADSCLDFTAHFWVAEYGDAYDKQIEATELIYNALNEAKIKIPYPTMDVNLKK